MVAAMARSRAGFFPIRSAFPGLATGRRPHCRFRGLLELYTRYACQIARPPLRGLCRGVPARPVSRTGRPPAIESNHQLFEWVLPPLGISPFGAHARPPAPHGAGRLFQRLEDFDAEGQHEQALGETLVDLDRVRVDLVDFSSLRKRWMSKGHWTPPPTSRLLGENGDLLEAVAGFRIAGGRRAGGRGAW